MKTAATQQTGMKQQEFEKLFSEHGAMVYRAAYSVTGNKHEAQDVQQDVFLKLIDDGRTLEFTTNPAGYLYRMAINKALESHRKRERKKETDDGLEPLEVVPVDVNQREKDMRENLLEAIAQLDPGHVEMLVLSVDHGYTDEEIGEILGKSPGAVRVTLHRVRERLKDLMCR
jgi:RNA polymerase sigma-70 factor (ECF subfamily)